MLNKLKFILRRKDRNTQNTSRPSRESKEVTERDSTHIPQANSRDAQPSSPWMPAFEGFRGMLKDFSKRLEAIKGNPEETYLVNTEIGFRLLAALENLAHLTERNTTALEKLTSGEMPSALRNGDESDKKRRAREVLSVLEKLGPLTYEELRRELRPQISYNRVTALVSEMIRDGIPLKREGEPGRTKRVSLGEP